MAGRGLRAASLFIHSQRSPSSSWEGFYRDKHRHWLGSQGEVGLGQAVNAEQHKPGRNTIARNWAKCQVREGLSKNMTHQTASTP